MLFRRGLDGQATAVFVVDATGRPEPGSFRLLAATHDGLEPTMRQLVAKTWYCPAARDGHPVRARKAMTVQFHLHLSPRNELLYAEIRPSN